MSTFIISTWPSPNFMQSAFEASNLGRLVHGARGGRGGIKQASAHVISSKLVRGAATTNREYLQPQQRTITRKNKSIPTDAPAREKRMWPLFPTEFARTREPWIPFRHGERVLSLDSIPSLRTASLWSTCRHLPFLHQSKLVNP